MEKIADIEYLYASARVRVLENHMLNRERVGRLAEAATDIEAAKILEECGYGKGQNLLLLDQMIEEKRQYTFSEAEKMLPNSAILDLFRAKYDYHNLKTIIKGEAQHEPYETLLIHAGKVPVKIMLESIRENQMIVLPFKLRERVSEAREVLNRTRDPRLCDTILDRAMYADMLCIAKNSKVRYLIDYVRLLIDNVNLRMIVRLYKMEQSFAHIQDFYIDGGTIPQVAIKQDTTPDTLQDLYSGGHPLFQSAEVGAAILNDKASLVELDIVSDNAVLMHLQKAKYVGFGVEPVLAYVAAIELEVNIIHTIMTLRKKITDGNEILKRVRKTYV